MTTEIKIISEDNLYKSNRILNLQNYVAGGSNYIPIGGVSLVAKRRNASESGDKACKRVSLYFMEHIFTNEFFSGKLLKWFVSHDCWMEKSAVNSHNKVWKYLNKRFASLVEFAELEGPELNFLDANERKMRFAGLASVTPENLLTVCEIARNLSSSFMVIGDVGLEERSVETLYKFAFPVKLEDSTSVHWHNLCQALCPLGNIVVRVSGLFDDHEVAIDLLYDPQTMNLKNALCDDLSTGEI